MRELNTHYQCFLPILYCVCICYTMAASGLPVIHEWSVLIGHEAEWSIKVDHEC